jgi:sugar phosphate isomerase/epimerase
MHVHDNHGEKDEHLWPGDGNIDWPAAGKAIKTLAATPAAVLEIHSNLGADPHTLSASIEKSFALLD